MAPKIEVFGDFGTLRAEREIIEVQTISPGYKPDPNWRYIDKAGHGPHRYEDGGYPTLIEVDEDPYWCDTCREAHIDLHFECALGCEEVIEPGVIQEEPGAHYITGLAHYYLNDQLITQEEYLRLSAELLK